MEISELTLKLIIILIPGALASMLSERLSVHKDWTPFKFIINSIVLGIFAYLSLQLFENLLVWIHNAFSKENHLYETLNVWNTISNGKIIPYLEVVYSSIFGIILGILVTVINFYKVINKIAQKLKLTNKYGDENLFSYFLNAKEIEIVYVRHIKNNLTYHGYIRSFSETDTISELVLSNVSVYEYSTSIPLYEVDQIYLSFDKSEIIIEKAIIVKDVRETQTPS